MIESLAIDTAVLARAVARVIGPAFTVEHQLDDPAREGYHHQKVIPRAGALLTPEALAADPAGTLRGAIKANVNLLSSFETMLGVTFLEAPDPGDLRDHAEALLRGDAPLEDRLGAFLAWCATFPDDGARKRSINATVASYLLAVSDPARYAFCKPTVYTPAARALTGAAETDPVRRVAHCTELYRALLPVLRDEYGLPVSDLMHVHIAMYLVERADGAPTWAGLDADPPSLLERHLADFAEVADEWLMADAADIAGHYSFFQAFFEADRLARAEWPDVQEMGGHLHSMGANKLALARAFGNSNHDVEHYRRSFEYLARGADPLAARLDRLNDDPAVKMFGLGASVLGELAGQLFAGDYSLLNGRSEAAMARLGRWSPDDRRLPLGARVEAFSRAVAPVVEAYERIVGRQTDVPVRLEVDHFLYWLDETAAAAPAIEGSPAGDGSATWLVAPGADASFWDESLREGIITIGWDDLGDLRQYESIAEIAARLKVLTGARHNPTNDARACYEFAHALRPGDLLFAKHGRQRILGHGTVQSDYDYDETRTQHRHVRRVAWNGTGEWDTGGRTLPMKTLTGISKYPDMVAELRAHVGLADRVAQPEPSFWWLNANPSVWSLAEAPVGHEQAFTSHNEDGNRRQRYANFQAARPGDAVVGYATGGTGRIVALGRVTRALGESDEGEAIGVEKTEAVENGLSLADMKGVEALMGAEPVRNNQATLLRLTTDEYAAIEALLTGTGVPELRPSFDPYTAEDAEQEIFAAPGDVRRWVSLLKTRKNLMLQGAPGVGKTFAARRLAYALLGARDTSRVQTVQFHQSYAYEDFVQGYRPTETGGFTLRNGAFFEFCRRAQDDPGRDYVFVVDEINRGNVSKVLGEVMMLIEPDKRGPEFAIRLAYEPRPGVTFHVPENVHLIGLMNTADRSLAVVDYALRRRFAFVTMTPAFETDLYGKHLLEAGAEATFVQDIARRLGALNAEIEVAPDLGRGYCVGHSFFCPRAGETPDWAWFRRVVETEVAPLLNEYWFDERAEAERAVAALLDCVPAL